MGKNNFINGFIISLNTILDLFKKFKNNPSKTFQKIYTNVPFTKI